MPSFQQEVELSVAPKGAAELVEVIALYKRFSSKDLSNKITDLCQELNGINIYVIKIALKAYKAKVAREQKAYHPRFFINLAKKLAKRIKNIPESFCEEDKEFKMPQLGKVI